MFSVEMFSVEKTVGQMISYLSYLNKSFSLSSVYFPRKWYLKHPPQQSHNYKNYVNSICENSAVLYKYKVFLLQSIYKYQYCFT